MHFNLLTFSFKLTLSYEVHIVTYDEKWYGSANYVLNVICAEENRTMDSLNMVLDTGRRLEHEPMY